MEVSERAAELISAYERVAVGAITVDSVEVTGTGTRSQRIGIAATVIHVAHGEIPAPLRIGQYQSDARFVEEGTSYVVLLGGHGADDALAWEIVERIPVSAADAAAAAMGYAQKIQAHLSPEKP